MNNAGDALMGPFEAASAAQIEFFLDLSSIGGVITFPMRSPYHASRWAVERYSESVAYALERLGIQVQLIEPGGVATDSSPLRA